MFVSVTDGRWFYSERSIKTEGGVVVAHIPAGTPEHQAAADGEFIAAMRNNAGALLDTLLNLRQKEERLLRRIARLEAELYGG